MEKCAKDTRHYIANCDTSVPSYYENCLDEAKAFSENCMWKAHYELSKAASNVSDYCDDMVKNCTDKVMRDYTDCIKSPNTDDCLRTRIEELEKCRGGEISNMNAKQTCIRKLEEFMENGQKSDVNWWTDKLGDTILPGWGLVLILAILGLFILWYGYKYYIMVT